MLLKRVLSISSRSHGWLIEDTKRWLSRGSENRLRDDHTSKHQKVSATTGQGNVNIRQPRESSGPRAECTHSGEDYCRHKASEGPCSAADIGQSCERCADLGGIECLVLSLFNPTERVPLYFLSLPRSSVGVFSGSSLQNRGVCLVSSDQENGQSSWQSLKVKMFLESRVIFAGFSCYTSRYPNTWCMGQPTSKVRYLPHVSTYTPTEHMYC